MNRAKLRKSRGGSTDCSARRFGMIDPSELISLREMTKPLAEREEYTIYSSLVDLHAVLNLITRVKHDDVAFFEPVENFRLETILTSDFHDGLMRHVILDEK